MNLNKIIWAAALILIIPFTSVAKKPGVSKINAGHQLHFETTVEDKEYYTKDHEIPPTKGGIAGKTEGTIYICYVRLNPNP